MNKEALKHLREAKDLTQKELADMVLISQSMIARYELGTKEPSLAITIALSKALECTVDALVSTQSEAKQKD